MLDYHESLSEYIIAAQSLLEVLQRSREVLELQLPTGRPKAKAKRRAKNAGSPAA